MRRKLFFCILLTIISLTMALSYYEEKAILDDFVTGHQNEYAGKIVSIQSKGNGNYNLVVKFDEGQKVLIKYYGNQTMSYDLYGKEVSFAGELKVPDRARNPGCFDYNLYLKSLGIEYTCNVDKIEVNAGSQNIYDKYCRALLMRKEAFLATIDDEVTRNFVDGILFGNTSNLEEELHEEFKTNGTAHILAVSGLHIGIIYKLLQGILGKRKNFLNFFITVIMLWSLGILAGWTPSVIRAIGMILMKIYALYKDKRYDSLTALSVIALILVMINPYVIFNVSFQMSFLAALSIIFIMPHIPKKIPDFMAIILAVNIGLIPYQTYQFNTFSVTSFLANIPVVYLSGILLTIAFVQFIVFLVTGFNISLLTQAMSSFVINCNSLMTLGTEQIDVVSSPIWLLALFYSAGGFVLSETFYLLWARKKRIIAFSILISICMTAFFFNYLVDDDFVNAQIVFVDVGQGDCIHIKAGNKDVLIDGGGSVSYEVGKKTVKPYLLKNGVRDIELAIATHKHKDHYNGLMELKEEGLLDTIETGLTAGKKFRIDDEISIETLWPVFIPEDDIDQEKNENCSVFMINYEGIKILVTGDLDQAGEAKMIEYYENLRSEDGAGIDTLKADILKIGHHGSQYSTSLEFLEAVNPKYCVIQVGNNNYGHPHTKTIEKCVEKCIILLRNDIHGAIGFSVKEGTINYCTMSYMNGN